MHERPGCDRRGVVNLDDSVLCAVDVGKLIGDRIRLAQVCYVSYARMNRRQ